MPRLRTLCSLMLWFALVLTSACNVPSTSPGATAVATTTPVSAGQAEKKFEDFNPEHFDHSTVINNYWFPLTPGTQFVYDGETVEAGEKVPHQIIITVTDLTKVIGGVRSVVTWDRDFSAGELVEAELAFFAQDRAGNVWRMGEYPEEYENGVFVVAPTWVHGLQEARAGIAMPAVPKTGTPSYSQGWGPAVDWTDRGQVEQTGQEVCVPVDCYQDVLVIAETSQSEIGAFQLKYFAPGLGNIRTDWKGTDVTQETLELTAINQLDAAALAEARAEALKLETHAYQISPEMYAYTLPLEYPEGIPALDVAALPTLAPTAAAPAQNRSALNVATDEVIVYAADIPENASFELDFIDDSASPGGKLIGLPNNGDELDPPPENDPHVTFTIAVDGGVPYSCWVHMKVGAPKGKSQANLIWAQISGAVDAANQSLTMEPGSKNYLTAQGPQQEGWTWVRCNLEGSETQVTFAASGEVTVRLQAGAEGVGFDQFILSSTDFLHGPPETAIVEN